MFAKSHLQYQLEHLHFVSSFASKRTNAFEWWRMVVTLPLLCVGLLSVRNAQRIHTFHNRSRCTSNHEYSWDPIPSSHSSISSKWQNYLATDTRSIRVSTDTPCKVSADNGLIYSIFAHIVYISSTRDFIKRTKWDKTKKKKIPKQNRLTQAGEKKINCFCVFN